MFLDKEKKHAQMIFIADDLRVMLLTRHCALKEVTVETGLVVKVPMFINQGDKIIVTTWDGKYSSRA